MTEHIEVVREENWETQPGHPAACFDYLWTKGLSNALSSVKLGEGSDHLPVLLQISVGEP